jgi:broad specificity phosphatase PhoE
MRLYLVRHGRAAATFGEAVDPGLDPTGAEQAEWMARKLYPLGPLDLVSSPMRRTRETAVPLERLWKRAARVEPAVSEIPSPAAMTLEERHHWLRGVMTARWSELDAELRAWRDRVVEAVRAMRSPAVVVSHFIAINVAVGAAVDDDRVVIFSPDHCSVTVLGLDDGRLSLVEQGVEGATRVL